MSPLNRFFLMLLAVLIACYMLSQIGGCAHSWSFGREVPLSVSTSARGTCAHYGRELDVHTHTVSASVDLCIRERNQDGGAPP